MQTSNQPASNPAVGAGRSLSFDQRLSAGGPGSSTSSSITGSIQGQGSGSINGSASTSGSGSPGSNISFSIELQAEQEIAQIANEPGNEALIIRLAQEGVSLTDNSDVGPGKRFESFSEKLAYIRGLKVDLLTAIIMSMVSSSGWGPTGQNEGVEEARTVIRDALERGNGGGGGDSRTRDSRMGDSRTPERTRDRVEDFRQLRENIGLPRGDGDSARDRNEGRSDIREARQSRDDRGRADGNRRSVSARDENQSGGTLRGGRAEAAAQRRSAAPFSAGL